MMISAPDRARAAAEEAEVRRLMAASRLGGWLTACIDGVAVAWHSSTSRALGRQFASPILESRSATIVTTAVAAIVALLSLRLRSTPEPAMWVVPTAVLVVALIAGVRTLVDRSRAR